MSNPMKIITRYLQFQYEKDLQENVFLTYNLMFALCNHHIDKKTGKKMGGISAWPKHDNCLVNFLLRNGDPAFHILSFIAFNSSHPDSRNLSHENLLELGLQKKVLRKELNSINRKFWGVAGSDR